MCSNAACCLTLKRKSLLLSRVKGGDNVWEVAETVEK